MESVFYELQSIVDEFVKRKKKIMVLEAGCGSRSYVNLNQNSYLVGIDISQKQLDRNTYLDKKILGDIQNYNFTGNFFDIIICFYVLEHLKNPDHALINFVKAIKKNGIIVIGLPNVFSIKGLVTKFTPHWFHVWAYRNLMGKKYAGNEDRGPFPTFMSFSVSPNALIKFCKKNNLKIKHFKLYETWEQRTLTTKSKIIKIFFKGLANLLNMITLGKLNTKYSDVIMVIQK